MKKIHKKTIISSIILIMLTINLTACSEETQLLTTADYELNYSNGITTSKGIGIGSTSDEFLDAYAGYDMEISIDGGAYQAYVAGETSFTDSAQTILPTFFIDDMPVTIEQVCTENEIERSDLLSLLSSEDYLANHKVTYYYMIFSWENGAIADIQSDYMDYNEDAVYYNEM